MTEQKRCTYTRDLQPRKMERLQESMREDTDSEEIIYEIMPDEEEMTETECVVIDSDPVRGMMWTDASVRLLLAQYKDLSPKVGKTYALRNKISMWREIHKKFTLEQYNFTIDQLMNKWKSLSRSFKNMCERNNKRTGLPRISCLYEKELGEILFQSPHFVLSSTESGMTREDMLHDGVDGLALHAADPLASASPSFAMGASPSSAESSCSAPASCSATSAAPEVGRERTPKRRKKATVVHEMRELRKMKFQMHRERLLAYEARTRAIEKKNELLEQLIRKMDENA